MPNNLLENKKENNYMNIINTISLFSISVIVFFIYLSVNDKLTDVKQLTIMATEFISVTNEFIIDSEPQITKLLHNSNLFVNSSTDFLEEISYNSLETVDDIQYIIDDFNNRTNFIINDLDDVLYNLNRTLNVIYNLLSIVDDKT